MGFSLFIKKRLKPVTMSAAVKQPVLRQLPERQMEDVMLYGDEIFEATQEIRLLRTDEITGKQTGHILKLANKSPMGLGACQIGLIESGRLARLFRGDPYLIRVSVEVCPDTSALIRPDCYTRTAHEVTSKVSQKLLDDRPELQNTRFAKLPLIGFEQIVDINQIKAEFKEQGKEYGGLLDLLFLGAGRMTIIPDDFPDGENEIAFVALASRWREVGDGDDPYYVVPVIRWNIGTDERVLGYMPFDDPNELFTPNCIFLGKLQPSVNFSF